MLVHSYLTNGFVPMAEVFLKSLKKTHAGNEPLVWLDARGLKAEHIEALNTSYPKPKLLINNLPISMRSWAERAGTTVAELKKYKRQCEQTYVSNNNKVWKLMTAGDDRVKRLQDAMWPYSHATKVEMPSRLWMNMPDYVAHFDIDTLFRKDIRSRVDYLMTEADIWLKLRPNHDVVKARITIDCMLIRPTDTVRKFFDSWISIINSVPPSKRPIGFGQSSCWYAFEEMKDKLSYNTLPLEFGLPGRNKPEDVIWTGNVHRLAKADCVKVFAKEMKSWKM